MTIVWYIIYIHTCQGTLIKSNSTASSSFQSEAQDIHLVERFANFLKKSSTLAAGINMNQPCHSCIYPSQNILRKQHAIHLMRLLCDIGWQQPFGVAFVWRNPGFYWCFTSFCPWLGSQVANVNQLILIFWIIAVYFYVGFTLTLGSPSEALAIVGFWARLVMGAVGDGQVYWGVLNDRNDVNTSDHKLSNLVGLPDSPSFGASFVTFYSVLSGIFRIVWVEICYG